MSTRLPGSTELPLDHPSLRHATRIYFALTNRCNRACPWCSTYSSPSKSTFLTLDAFTAAIPVELDTEVQLEGGEPTVHPEFWRFVEAARARPRMRRIILCTNGVRLPRQAEKLEAWIRRLGTPLTLKLSINHHLLGEDPGLLDLAEMLRTLFEKNSALRLILNVRLRKTAPDQDQWVVDAVTKAGLLPWANVFFLQRYGLASSEREWEKPFIVSNQFKMLNPDGHEAGTDLVERSEAMGRLP